jgi:hypothetical protein
VLLVKSPKTVNLVKDLKYHSARRYSQNGEDGMLERLLEIVGVTNRYYVELGAGWGNECNTLWLRERGWSGLMMDANSENPTIPIYKEFVTAENVVPLFEKYGVPESFDVLSIDIDGNDYWVWKALSSRYRPRIVIIEYNAGVPVDVAVVMPYDPAYRWTGQQNVGQSLLALRRISMEKGYSLVYASAPNAFLVLSSLLPDEYQEVSVAKAAGVRWGLREFAIRMRWHAQLKRLPWARV